MASLDSSECRGDGFEHPIAILQDIMVPEAEDSPSVAAKHSIARVVLAVAAVLSAIGLDDEAPLNASKIDYVRRDRMLTPETPAERIAARSFPKRSFC